MPRLIDVCTVRTKDGTAVEGNRKAVATTVTQAVKPRRKKH